MAKKLKAFNAGDYEDMFINVNVLKVSDNLLETELGSYPEFRADIEELSKDRENILRYICLVYDPKSPYVLKYDNPVDRKIDAAQEVGFKAGKKGRFPELVEHFMKCQNTLVNEMIIRFCRITGNRTYGLLVAANEFYWGQMNRLVTVKAGKDEEAIKEAANKAKLFEAAVEHEKRISELESKLLAQDRNPYLNDTLWAVVNREDKAKINYSPEVMAKTD